MKISSIMTSIAVTALFGCACALAQNSQPKVQQKTFATPEDAVVALVDSNKSGDLNALRALFGPAGEKLLDSGDPVRDQRSREVFLVAYMEKAALMTVKIGRAHV